MRHIIENEFLKVEIADLGATLTKLIDKKSGVDIVLGYDSDEEYKTKGGNIGASVGRNANRIGKGQITLNDILYQLSINDNMNQLHGGGDKGFAFKNWKVVEKSDKEIKFNYFSKDLEEGFPGNLNVYVTYKLDGNNLIWSYEGESDKDTLFNMTNHSYFNLGDEDIMNEYLHITSDKYSPVDEYSLTLDEVKDVKGTAYDFTTFTRLEDNLSKLDKGIDNNYVWEYLGDKLMASLKNDKLQLNVYSDLPDMHLYTSYYLNGDIGKYGLIYNKYKALCLECQYYPNGINYSDYIKPILKKGEKMSHYIRYELINL